MNFEAFQLTGEYTKIAIPEGVENDSSKKIFITGCGRSGTTLLFKLLSESAPEGSLCLNEPREIYLNADAKEFDIWSK